MALSLPQVLSKYLMEIEDLEQRFTLATKTELYDVGIDVSHCEPLVPRQ